MAGFYFLTLAVLVFAAFWLARRRAAVFVTKGGNRVHSLPVYHGLLAASMTLIAMLAVYLIAQPMIDGFSTRHAFSVFPPEDIADELRRSSILRDIQNVAANQFRGEPSLMLKEAAARLNAVRFFGSFGMFVLGVVAAGAGLLLVLRQIHPDFRARNQFERFVKIVLIVCASIAVLTTIGIVFSVLFETFRFFFDPAIKGRPSIPDFLFGTNWNPQAAMRADQGDATGAFGIVPLVAGTILISLIAVLFAGPIGLFAAIYMAEYASPSFRAWAKPVLEILAGIPTVVLGFFAALTVAPLIRDGGAYLGLDVASESALAAGLVMGMMIIPFVSSLSDDVITAVPQSLRDGSLGMGATRSETIARVVLPAALPGIVSAFMLAISRAVGETMIVVMAAGLAANLTFNPLDAVTTFTVQIKTILVGDQEFDSAKTLAAFALGFVLFFFTLTLNVIALAIVRKYREQYD